MSSQLKKSAHFEYFTGVIVVIFLWFQHCQQFNLNSPPLFRASLVSTLCLKSPCWCNKLMALSQHCLCQDYVTIMGSEKSWMMCYHFSSNSYWWCLHKCLLTFAFVSHLSLHSIGPFQMYTCILICKSNRNKREISQPQSQPRMIGIRSVLYRRENSSITVCVFSELV